MPVVEIPLGEWMPDAPSFKNPGCEVADNAIPIVGGYGPIRGLVDSEQTVSQQVRGAQQVFTGSNGSTIVGGGDTILFTRRADFTETTGYSTIGEGAAWDFAQFNNFMIAVAPNNDPQYLENINSDDTWVDLPGSPPVAKRVAKVGDFLMLGSIDGTPNRIQWSSFNAPGGDWTPSRLTQAGFLDLPTEYGEVQKIVGGRFATVFQERGITRLSYVGPPAVWRADDISKDRGTISPFGVVTIGYLTYFIGQDGFFMTDGSSIQSIGSDRVNKWFFDNIEQSKVGQVCGAVDWQNKCIFWAFNSESTQYDRAIIYAWEQNKWSSMTLDFSWLVGAKLDGIDLDSLDALYASIDDIPVSLDSAEFQPQNRRLAAFVQGDSTCSYQVFNGTPLDANWETGEFQPSPGQRVFVSEASPIMDAVDWGALITLLLCNNRGQLATSQTKETGWNGFAAVRGEANKMAIRVNKTPGDWTDIQAVNVRYQPAGYK